MLFRLEPPEINLITEIFWTWSRNILENIWNKMSQMTLGPWRSWGPGGLAKAGQSPHGKFRTDGFSMDMLEEGREYWGEKPNIESGIAICFPFKKNWRLRPDPTQSGYWSRYKNRSPAQQSQSLQKTEQSSLSPTPSRRSVIPVKKIWRDCWFPDTKNSAGRYLLTVYSPESAIRGVGRDSEIGSYTAVSPVCSNRHIATIKTTKEFWSSQ